MTNRAVGGSFAVSKRRARSFAAVVTVLVLTGARAADPPEVSARPKATIERDEWSPLGWEDRHDVMTWGVLPTMARLFARFQGKSSPDLTCRTCHGDDAERVHYKMPRGLVTLDPAHLPNRHSRDPQEARLARFMADEVTPAMREMLGTSQVGCFTCHPKKETYR